MNKKVFITTLASIALFGCIGTSVNYNMSNNVQATKMPSLRYVKHFYKVRITKKTAYYKVIRGKDEAHNKYKKMGYLKPGQIVYVRARGVVWGWTIGKRYKYCSFRDEFDYSWFTTKLKNKKKTKTVKKPSAKATFINHGSNYTYNDENVRISLDSYDVQYHKATNSEPAKVNVHFIFTNKSRKTINAADYIQKRVKASQDGNYLDLELNSSNLWVKSKKSKRISATVIGNLNDSDSLVFIFTAPNSSKETGVVIISSLTDSEPMQTNNVKTNVVEEKPANTNVNSNKTPSSNTQNQSSIFSGFPANASLLEKWDIVKSLSGSARQQAENQLMSEEGLSQNGHPLVSSSEFENQINSISNTADQMKNWILQGR